MGIYATREDKVPGQKPKEREKPEKPWFSKIVIPLLALILGGVGATVVSFFLPILFGDQTPNKPPTAVITSVNTEQEYYINLPYTFHAADSDDPDGDNTLMTHQWFVDGTSLSKEKYFTHTFPDAKIYRLELIVTDEKDCKDDAVEYITVKAP